MACNTCTTTEVSDKIRTWLEESDRPVGAVVRTLDGGKPIKATRGEQGWTFEKDVWGIER